MSVQLNPVDPAANATFGDLITLSNAIVNVIATQVVTANTAANGSVTIGNGYVSGILGATVLVATALRGGSVQNSNTINLQSNISGNSSITIFLGNSTVNATVNSSVVNVGTLVANAAAINYLTLEQIQMGNTIIQDLSIHQGVGGAPVLLDSWLLAGFRSAEYFVNIDDLASSNWGCTKLAVVQGGGNVLMTEWASLYTSGTPVGTFSANSNVTHVTVWFTTGGSANANITATKTMLRI